MICAWKELLAVLPLWMRKDVDQFVSEPLKEIRLRVNAQPELITEEDSFWLEQYVTQDDVNYTVNAASRYSPWSAASAAMVVIGKQESNKPIDSIKAIIFFFIGVTLCICFFTHINRAYCAADILQNAKSFFGNKNAVTVKVSADKLLRCKVKLVVNSFK